MTDSKATKALFDAHCHIISPDFSLVANQGYLPPMFTVEDYQTRVTELHPNHSLQGGAVVSGSFQGFDQSYLIAALQQLGKGFVGVTQLPAETSDEVILDLHQQGVGALRFNLKRGGSEDVSQLTDLANRVYDLCGWHVELYVDSCDLEELEPILCALPKVSVDHLGLTRIGQTVLMRLAEASVHIKATGFGRLDFEALPVMQQIHQINPSVLMFGTDLPSTRAPRPYQPEDLIQIETGFDKKDSHNILYQNAMHFYGLR